MPASVEVSNAVAISNASEAGRGATIENGIVIDMDDRFQDEQATSKERETYPQDKFDNAFPGWKKLIADGKKTADDIIAMASSKHPLTDAQKAAIRGEKKADAPAGEQTMFDRLKKAMESRTDVDALDADADLIGEVSDPDQRAELVTIYNARREELTK